MDAFKQRLRELGWDERSVTFEERWAADRYDRLHSLAGELVALKVDLILASGGTPAVEAAVRATRTIPIVFPTLGDPVAERFAQSLAHPGGNVTGISNLGTELYVKRLALLKEAAPGITYVALIVNTANLFMAEAVQASRVASRSLGIQLEVFDVRTPSDFEATFQKVSRWGAQAVLVGGDDTLVSNLAKLGSLALQYKLPLVTGYNDTGVLLAYNRDALETYRRAAAYVDKILKGANPGDLPIEQPTKFILVVNLKTAKALGITIPQSLLLRADEVIQ